MSTALDGKAAWPAATRLLARWLERRERVDALLDTLPAGLAGPERARCQNLVLGVIRHYGRLDAALGRLVPHPPRFVTRAILFVAGFELIEAHGSPASEGRDAKIVHHAVEQTKSIASPAESRMVNAVVRKLASVLAAEAPPANEADAEVLAEYFSHPAWLVRSWLAQFGPAATRSLLEWNEQPATVYARWRAAGAPPDFLKPTQWPTFFEIPPGRWSEVEPLLKSGQLYLQDPATRLPVELLAPKSGEEVLDLCAAPGGKALLIADLIKTGRMVAVDLPSPRIDRLKENLARTGEVGVALVQADVLKNLGPVLREHKLPATYPAVLLDVPCSNTGVMRHRVDVKWRLQAGDFKKHPEQQLAMLHAATRFVAPGGRLVYSTCSIDAEENEHVIEAFFGSRAGGAFKLEKSVVSRPWTTGHDGGGAFLLRRVNT
jgi:16S rRNA (cytosine967-C5)-methyltransferase